MNEAAAAPPPGTARIRSTGALVRSTMMVSGIRGVDFGLSFLVSMLLANRFGASGELDAFFLARRTTVGFADTIRKLVSQIVMPAVVARGDRGEPLSIHGLPRRFYVFLGGFGVLLTLGTFVPSALISVFAPGFTAHRHALAATMMAIMMPLLPIAVVASLLMAVLQANRRYVFSEGTNIVQRGILVFVLAIAVPPLGIVAGAWTMLLAGLFGLAILLIGAWPIVHRRPGSLIESGAEETAEPAEPAQPPLVHAGGGIAAAIVLGLLFQATTLIDFGVATTLREGGVAVLEYGARLVSLVPGLLMASLNTVLYPELVRAMQDPDPEIAANGLAKFQRLGFFVQLPVSIGMMAGAELMVRILFGHGAFGEEGVLLTTGTTMGYAAAAIFLTPLNATSAAIYADPKASCFADIAMIAAGGIGFRVVMLVVAVPIFGVVGIAGAAAASTLAVFLLAQWVAKRRFGAFGLAGQARDFARTGLCGAAAALACAMLVRIVPEPQEVLGRLALLAAIGLVLVTVYTGAAVALHVPELARLRPMLLRRRGAAAR